MTEKQNSSRTKTIITTIVTIAAISIGSKIGQSLLTPKITFDDQLLKVSETINTNCPMMVDSDTRLDNTMTLPEKILNYNYTLVNYTIEELDSDALNKELTPSIVNNVKTNPDMENFRKNEVTLKYNYKDKDGIFITSIVVEPADYK